MRDTDDGVAGFAPEIRKRVNMDAIFTLPSPSHSKSRTEIRRESESSFKGEPGIDHGKRSFSAEPHKFPPPTVRDWRRPHLVNVEEFRENLLSAARDMITNPDRPGSDGSVEEAIHPPISDIPPLEPDQAPLAFESVAVETDVIPKAPPEGISSGTDRKSSQRVRSSRRRGKSFAQSPGCSPKSQRRVVKLAEQLAARRILHEWTNRKDETTTINAGIQETNKYQHMKRLLKDVVNSSLHNSRLIREELIAIHSDLNKDQPRRIDLITGSPVVIPFVSGDESPKVRIPPLNIQSLNALNEASSPGRPAFLFAARVLLRGSVSSPGAVEEMLTELTRDIGRDTIKMCIGQITMHPKALVLVVKCNNASLSADWVIRIRNCKYIEAYDESFPMDLSGPAPLPWEVRIKSNMASIQPQWSKIGLDTTQADSSIG